MQVRDQLMNVMEHEVKSNQKLIDEARGHKNIVHLHEIIDDQGEEDKLVLVMEYCPQGELLSWDEEKEEFIPSQNSRDENGFLPEEKIKHAFFDIAEGLNFMHSNGVLHRDIKPQNILIDFNGTAKIADFGVSKVLEEDSDTVKGCNGTYQFLAPEICDDEITEYSGKAADVWALGVTLYAMLYNKVPFWGESELELMDNIMTQELEIPGPEYR